METDINISYHLPGLYATNGAPWPYAVNRMLSSHRQAQGSNNGRLQSVNFHIRDLKSSPVCLELDDEAVNCS